MNMNRITLIGFTGREPKSSATQTGRNMTKLSVATTKRYKDSDQKWQEKTQWHTCIAYGPVADQAAKIQTGALVFLEGELAYREYDRTIETEAGPVKVQWPITEIVVDTVSLLDRKSAKGREAIA